uniref:Uncharacterized protein n=1 Tax=Rhizophora mucronata TaxID=61149 RepID=A0A2P2NYY7_RHIMU
MYISPLLWVSNNASTFSGLKLYLNG